MVSVRVTELVVAVWVVEAVVVTELLAHNQLLQEGCYGLYVRVCIRVRASSSY